MIYNPAFKGMKGPVLPKILWEKGKSKFLFIRLVQEKFYSINDLYRSKDWNYYKPKFTDGKIMDKLKQKICRHQFKTENTLTGLILDCPKCGYNKILWKR